MSETTTQPASRCLRCGRTLRAPGSVAAGFGRTCKARIRAAALTEAAEGFTAVQVDKARELIEQQAIIPSSRPGLFAAVSSEGTTVYLVDARERSCTCKAAANGRQCYHVASALILEAAANARRAA
jgi:hypothetical protein